jgi:hypothetical protein
MKTQMETPETQATILVKLRTRMNDLLRMGIVTPDGFGMYQQTVLQLLQEFDRRKATCFTQAEQLKAQAAASEAQGHAFSVCGSVLFSVVNGYIDLEEKRLKEEQERAREVEEKRLMEEQARIREEQERLVHKVQNSQVETPPVPPATSKKLRKRT